MTEEQVRDILKEVYDPEIGVNIVDLGLIYQVEIRPDGLYIRMTMTSPTCPLSELITRNINQVLRQSFPDLGDITIDLVWEPRWSPDMMSNEAKIQLGWKESK